MSVVETGTFIKFCTGAQIQSTSESTLNFHPATFQGNIAMFLLHHFPCGVFIFQIKFLILQRN